LSLKGRGECGRGMARGNLNVCKEFEERRQGSIRKRGKSPGEKLGRGSYVKDAKKSIWMAPLPKRVGVEGNSLGRIGKAKKQFRERHGKRQPKKKLEGGLSEGS